MSTHAISGRQPANRPTIPRWMALVVLLVGISVGHGVVPWFISSLMPHNGWIAGRPSIWNLLGLIPIGAGAALLVWILVVGMTQSPERVRLALTPSVILMHGPYAFTRNPMYVGELGLWLGWALLFGSAGVLIGFVIFFALVNFVVIPREERSLELIFGQAYLEYKKTVPRWWGSA